MKTKTLFTGLAIAALALGVSMPAAAADEDDSGMSAPTDRHSRMEQRLQSRRDHAVARAERLRKRAEAYRFLINPWAEMHHRALQAHNDAIKSLFDNRSAWDRALFDQQHRWIDALADNQRAWADAQADWQLGWAEQQREQIERVMDAQADWMLAQQPLPPVYGPAYWW